MPTASRACCIIAEAGVNHGGSPDDALAMVEAAASAGADAVKFQSFDPVALTTRAAPTAAYQSAAGAGGNQAEMLAALVLPDPAMRRAAELARARGLEFLSTPFDLTAARFLVDELGMGRIKVGSGDLNNLPFLLALSRMERPLILSTGMATLGEVRQALGVIVFAALAGAREKPGLAAFAAALDAPEASDILDRTIVMQCTTQYPAPPDQANLRVMDAYAALGVRPGYSDHTLGMEVALAAAARGAEAIEKHFTLSRDRPGPDQKASLEPEELTALVAGVRRVSAALGANEKAPVPAELANMAVARRSLVAASPIAKGDLFSERNLTAKRPGVGLEPGRLWELLGRPAGRDYAPDDLIEP